MKTINIVHIYPKEMNIYGDNGNILVLRKRLQWRGIKCAVHNVGVGDDFPNDTHIIVGGGGQDNGQSVIANDLQQKKSSLISFAKSGVPMLMICGMYQMLGHYFKTADGHEIPGIGVLDITTIAGDGRLIGNIVGSTEQWGDLVGYENHSGRTTLGDKAEVLGKTLNNQGNNGDDGGEGAVQNNVFGTYLHGPVLAKSPIFADYLLGLAIKAAGEKTALTDIDDSLENLAAGVAKKRPR